MRPTLVYEHLKLHQPRSLSISLEEALPQTTLPSISVTILKDRFIRWLNDYKILLEFCQEVLEKENVGPRDLVRYHNECETIKIYGLSLRDIRKLRDFYKNKTGDLSLEYLGG